MVCKTEANEIAQAHIESLRGKWALVTGATSGIGLETCRSLVGASCNVICCARDLEKGAKIASELRRTAGPSPGQVRVEQLDLADLKSIQKLAHRLERTLPYLDFLVLNGGVMATQGTKTKDGFEEQMGTNYIGHQFLAQLMLPFLRKTPSSDGARIVVLSSISHKWATVDPEDFWVDEKKFNPWLWYAKSKLACLLLAKELAHRTSNEKICVAAVHPGIIFTNITKNHDRTCMTGFVRFCLSFVSKTPQQGAATTLFALTDIDYESGSYLADCKPQRHKPIKDNDLSTKLYNAAEAEIKKFVMPGPCLVPSDGNKQLPVTSEDAARYPAKNSSPSKGAKAANLLADATFSAVSTIDIPVA